MIRKTDHSKTIIQILIISAVTVIAWIGFTIYHTVTKKTLSEIPKEILEPINPTLDQEVLKKIEGRISPTEENFRSIPDERRVKFEVEEEASPAAESEES